MCDLDFDVFQIFLTGPQFFLIRGKNDDLIFFSHKSLRKVQEFHDLGQMMYVASSKNHITIALQDESLMHLSAKTLEPQNKILMPGEIVALSVWQDQVAICAVRAGDYGFQLVGVSLSECAEKKSEHKDKRHELLKEESIVTEKSVNPQSQSSTPGQTAVFTPEGGGTPG